MLSFEYIFFYDCDIENEKQTVQTQTRLSVASDLGRHCL